MQNPLVNNVDRKRPRSVSPTPPASKQKLFTDGKTMATRLEDPLLRNGALNELMQTTMKHENNYSLDGEHVLIALSHVFFDAIGWNEREETNKE